MKRRKPGLVSWSLRAVALAGFVLLIGIGCTLELSGLTEVLDVWTCSTTVRNADGSTTTVTSDDAELQGLAPRAFVTGSGCAAVTRADIEDDFLRWVEANLPFRYDDQDGPWCIEEAVGVPVCVNPVAAAGAATCETPLPVAPSLCETADRCLVLEPDRVDVAAILTGMGLDDRSPVGFPEVRVRPTVEVRNSCPEPVRIYVDDAVQGDAPEDFELVANNCAPRAGTEEARIGRELLAAGSPGDACTFEVLFIPMRHAMARTAEKRFSQDTTELYSVPLSGRGRGGRLLPPMPLRRCFGPLVGARSGCTNATAPQTLTLDNNGPGRLTIESIVATGQFQTDAPATPFILEPPPASTTSLTFDVWWCADGGLTEDLASLLVTDNGVSASTEVFLERSAAGCP